MIAIFSKINVIIRQIAFDFKNMQDFPATNFFFFYVLEVFFRAFWIFIRHWYKDAFLFCLKKFLDILTSLDKIFAVKVSLRHLFEPMYRQKNIIGYVLGFIFRAFRIIFGVLIYGFLVLIFFFLFGIWAILPLWLLIKGF